MQKKRRRRRKKRILAMLYLAVFVTFCFLFGIILFQGGKLLWNTLTGNSNSSKITENTEELVSEYANSHGFSTKDYPESLLNLLENNPETKDFVLEYPLEKDKNHTIDLSEYKNSEKMPLLMQWDQRWGYVTYGDDMIAITGCGPTCLSMVAIHLLNDTTMDPAWMAKYSIEKGYCVPGEGTSWTLMSEGAYGLGLEATELPLDEERIIRNLKVGNPIICIMGPGDFTTSGHFIVLTGYKDGKITVNDPNSRANSEKLWEFDKIKNQIKNLWTYRVG